MMAGMRRRKLAPRTIAYARAVLRMTLAHAEMHGRVSRNVAALVPAPRKAATKLDDALDSDEAARVLQAAKSDPLEALAVLVLATGLRQGEALRLRWVDLDLDAGTLHVVKAKTAAGVRKISLPGFAVASLRDHRARQRTARMAASRWDDPGLVFTSPVGTQLDRSNVLRWWYDLTVRAGVGRRRFHASRHTAATLMLNNGVPLEVVSATLGHAGLAITADVYAKVRPELQRKAADAMQNVLGGAGSGA
jgi:integrase